MKDKKEKLRTMEEELRKMYDEIHYNYATTITIEPESDKSIIEGLREQLKKEKAKVRKLRAELKFEKIKTMKVIAAEEEAVAKAIAARPVNRLEAIE